MESTCKYCGGILPLHNEGCSIKEYEEDQLAFFMKSQLEGLMPEDPTFGIFGRIYQSGQEAARKLLSDQREGNKEFHRNNTQKELAGAQELLIRAERMTKPARVAAREVAYLKGMLSVLEEDK